MNKSIEQALTSLIPRYNGELPPELLELASSLLSQSRNKASNLKADEEIGRTYICAHIACERLKQKLNLPKIEPRPPLPPKIYDKLYTYLDTLLVARKRGRPPKSASAASTPTKNQQHRLPSRPTPTKTDSLAQYKTSTATTSTPTHHRRRRGLLFSNSTNDIPPWIHPVIRALCAELSSPAAAPHILAGVTTILTLPSPTSSSSSGVATQAGSGLAGEDKKDKLPALLVAVNIFVRTRLSGKEIRGAEYIALREEVLGVLEKVRGDEVLERKVADAAAARGGAVRGVGRGGAAAAGGESEKAWKGWEIVTAKDIDAWLHEIPSRGWLKLDWFENIVQGGGLEGEPVHMDIDTDGEEREFEGSGEGEGEDREGEGEGEISGIVSMQSGLGTMVQDRVDYLSEASRARYAVWERSVRARIEEMKRREKAGAGSRGEEMDVSVA